MSTTSLLLGDYREEVRGIVNHLLKRGEGQNLDFPVKLIGVALTVTDEGTKHDEAPYTSVGGLS